MFPTTSKPFVQGPSRAVTRNRHPPSAFEPVVPVGDGLFGVVTSIDRRQLFQGHTEFTVHPLDGHVLLTDND